LYELLQRLGLGYRMVGEAEMVLMVAGPGGSVGGREG